MAKRNKKGGWTGSSAGSNAVKSGGGPQVESWLQPSKKGPKKSLGYRIGNVVLFLLFCVAAGSLIYQLTPQNMAEYWELDEQKDAITKVEIISYDEAGQAQSEELTAAADVEAFYGVLDETRLKRLWFADNESTMFTDNIRIYVNGESEPAFDVGLAEERVYFLGMPTYDWYLEEDAPLMEYLNEL